MNPETRHTLATDWNRAGAMFNAEESHSLPDLEQLLIRTAAAAREEPVLMPMAATWLARHGNAIAEDRLATLIRTRLAPADQPGMGLLFIQAVQFADIPVMAAYLCLISLIFVVINLVVDLLYFAVDPRLRVGKPGGH